MLSFSDTFTSAAQNVRNVPMPTSEMPVASPSSEMKVGRRALLPAVPLADDDITARPKLRCCTYRPIASASSVSPVVNEADGPPTPKNAVTSVALIDSSLTVMGTLLLAVVYRLTPCVSATEKLPEM